MAGPRSPVTLAVAQFEHTVGVIDSGVEIFTLSRRDSTVRLIKSPDLPARTSDPQAGDGRVGAIACRTMLSSCCADNGVRV